MSIFGSWFAYYARSGLSKIRETQHVDWREFLLPNLGYFVLTLAKVLTWPLVLLFWFVTGMKPSPWTQLHEAAHKRRTIQATGKASASPRTAAERHTAAPTANGVRVPTLADAYSAAVGTNGSWYLALRASHTHSARERASSLSASLDPVGDTGIEPVHTQAGRHWMAASRAQ